MIMAPRLAFSHPDYPKIVYLTHFQIFKPMFFSPPEVVVYFTVYTQVYRTCVFSKGKVATEFRRTLVAILKHYQRQHGLSV